MYKLLIVDDEAEVRKGIIRKIDWGKYDFEIAGEAENGREALDIIEENIPDAVITDITMPMMDGLELTAVIKETYPTIKTIILTGFDDFKFAQQAIKYGVSDYILKPVMPSDIDELMAKLKPSINDANLYIFTRHSVTDQAHLHSRMFWLENGIFSEDAATGSASGPLGCYAARHNLFGSAARLELTNEQGFEMNRPSCIRIEIEQDAGEITAVKVGGEAHFMGGGYFEIE